MNESSVGYGTRSDPVDAARTFVDEHFPDAAAALVGGSVIRGDGTPTSDLDIVVIAKREDAPFRVSFVHGGWPIEVFVHTEYSLPKWIAKDGERRRPSMAMMVAEGVPIRGDDGLIGLMKDLATELLERGPAALTSAQLEDWRYRLTDLLDDFVGVRSPDEGMFAANDLATEVANLSLLLEGRWLGSGKWIPRALKQLDPHLSERLTSALAAYYRTDDKGPLTAVAEETLDRAGGRLFEGYYRAADRESSSESGQQLGP